MGTLIKFLSFLTMIQFLNYGVLTKFTQPRERIEELTINRSITTVWDENISYFEYLSHLFLAADNYYNNHPSNGGSKQEYDIQNWLKRILPLIYQTSSPSEKVSLFLKKQNKKLAKTVKTVSKIFKRTNHHDVLPWTCKTDFGWINLGNQHFPQYIPTAICSSTHCYNHLYRCFPKKWKVQVLKKLSNDESEDLDSASLPVSLRCSFKFETIEVPAFCECGNIRK